MIGAAVALQAGVSRPTVSLTDIQIHLWYETTGRLSSDVTQQPDFVGRNVIIGAGSAEEPANDLLIVVELKTSGEANVSTPLTVVATNAKGKVLASREFRGFLVTGGQVHWPLLVRNAGCAGEVEVTARFGRQHRSEMLSLQCAE